MGINYHAALIENAVLHIYNRSVSGVSLFRKDSDYIHFLNKYKEYIGPLASTYAYCLIRNHFHFVIKIHPVNDLTYEYIRKKMNTKGMAFLDGEITYEEYLREQFRNFFNSYSKKFNNRYKRHGALFQRSFKRTAIKTKADFLYYVFYVLHNPIHHSQNKGKGYYQHKYSSIHNYMGQADWITTKTILDLFADKADPTGMKNFKRALALWKNRIEWMRGWMPEMGFDF